MVSDRKIMVAVDDSEASAYAFTWALYHLISQNDHVVLLHVAPFVGMDLPGPDTASDYIIPPAPSRDEVEAAEKSVTEQSKELVNKYLQQCAQKNISCEGEVVKGDPRRWIIDEADRISADMVVVGSHAYGLIKRTLLGSISDYVLHNTQCTVVIIRQPILGMSQDALTSSGLPRKIVVAVDHSKQAFDAFKWALHNFCRESDKVIIYHVRNPTSLPVTAVGTGEFGMEDVYGPTDATEKDDVKALNESENLVEEYMYYASKETKISCEGMVVTGLTEQKVCEGLQALKADAVIVGSHGRGLLARTLLGSVSDYLSHNSPCPLIVVKMQKQKEDNTGEEAHKHST